MNKNKFLGISFHLHFIILFNMLTVIIALILVVECTNKLRSQIRISYSEKIKEGWNRIYQDWEEYDSGCLPNMKKYSIDHFYQYKYNTKVSSEIHNYSLVIEHLGELRVYVNGGNVYNEREKRYIGEIRSITKLNLLPYFFINGENIISFSTRYKAEKETINTFRLKITELTSSKICEDVKVESVAKLINNQYIVNLKETTAFNKMIINGVKNYSVYERNGELINIVKNYKAYGQFKVSVDDKKNVKERDISIQSCKINVCKDADMMVSYEKGVIEGRRECNSIGKWEITDKTLISNDGINNIVFDLYIFTKDETLEITIENNGNPYMCTYSGVYHCQSNQFTKGKYEIRIASLKRSQISILILLNNKDVIYRDNSLSFKDKITITGFLKSGDYIEMVQSDRNYYTNMDLPIYRKNFGVKPENIEVSDSISVLRNEGSIFLNLKEEIHKVLEIKLKSIEGNGKHKINYNLYVLHCPEYTVPFSVNYNFVGPLNVEVKHGNYHIYNLSKSNDYFSLQYCSPFKDMTINSIENGIKDVSSLTVIFNKKKLLQGGSGTVVSNEFPPVVFKYKLEVSDVQQLKNNWKEFFEGEKWPSYYVGALPQSSSRTRYYRMIYTNFIPLFDVVDYRINGYTSGLIKLFFNGVELKDDIEGKRFSFIVDQSLIRDGNNYIAFTVDRNGLNDDLEFEVVVNADEENCADESCLRRFCQNSTLFLKAEVGSFYTTECGYGRSGYKKYDCIEEDGEAIFKLEEHCENIAKEFEYDDNKLVFTDQKKSYSPKFRSETGHGHFYLNDTLPKGMKFDQETGEFSGRSTRKAS